jgi:hypothetical protein
MYRHASKLLELDRVVTRGSLHSTATLDSLKGNADWPWLAAPQSSAGLNPGHPDRFATGLKVLTVGT